MTHSCMKSLILALAICHASALKINMIQDPKVKGVTSVSTTSPPKKSGIPCRFTSYNESGCKGAPVLNMSIISAFDEIALNTCYDSFCLGEGRLEDLPYESFELRCQSGTLQMRLSPDHNTTQCDKSPIFEGWEDADIGPFENKPGCLHTPNAPDGDHWYQFNCDWPSCTKSGGASTKGDPRVQNLKGEKYDIQSEGTFHLFSVSRGATNLLDITGKIVHVSGASSCSNTYIANISLHGDWLDEIGLKNVQVRAVNEYIDHFSSKTGLDVNTHGQWEDISLFHPHLDAISASPTGIEFKFHQVSIGVDLDMEHLTKYKFRLINLNIEGAKLLTDVHIGGLLGYDDHSLAEIPAEHCDQLQLRKTRTFNPSKSLLSKMHIL